MKIAWKPISPDQQWESGHKSAGTTDRPVRHSNEADHTEFEIFPQEPQRSLDQLVIPKHVQHRIEIAIIQVLNKETLYDEWGLRKIDPHRNGTSLNFYGPPGTGKSMAAEAVAHRLGMHFIDVSYAEIESKYVGDTPKNIAACFRQASEVDAVLVFNEADSILGSRLSSVTQSSDHSVNVSRAEMLRQLDMFHGLIIFTTNFPSNYDQAFVRRIRQHVKFELPDKETRRILWEKLIPQTVPRTTEGLDLDILAEKSENLSGGDIVNVIISAATLAVSRTGAERVLRTEDLLQELDPIQNAKRDVGKTPDNGFRMKAVEETDTLPNALTSVPDGSTND